jgi:hypothetical protein
MSQSSSKSVISRRAIEEINKVWEQYEVLKAAQDEERRKKREAQKSACTELADLLDTFLSSPAGKEWQSRHGISSETLSVKVDDTVWSNRTVSVSFKVA